MEGDTLYMSEGETHRLRLVVDEDPSNPRTEYDQACNVVTVPGSRYDDVDKHGGPLAGAWAHYLGRHDVREAIDMFTRYAQLYHGATVREHHPHEGPTSVWYLTRETIEREGLTEPGDYLQGEINEYQAWAEGDVYGYVIERRITWVRQDGEPGESDTWEHVESYWGHYGYDWATQAARDAWVDFDPKQAEGETVH